MDLRSIAIIAHVDHGKTTLVDSLLRHSGTVRANQPMQDRAMDRGELERERGITILAKCTAIHWRGVRIDIVDTPGHVDFGGEVERVLGMVDGALVLVDAAEGPMPQTKFVVDKALRLGLRPIVAISKMDRADARPETVHEAVFDLFDALGATDTQLDFPVVYCSARHGWASLDPAVAGTDMTPLFEAVVAHVPAPATDRDVPFRMLISLLEADNFLGRLVSGRVLSGRVEANQTVTVLRTDGTVVEVSRLTKLLRAHGLERIAVERAGAGEIVTLAGLKTASVADTVAASESCAPIPAEPIDPPTIAMVFSVNDSPLAGCEGTQLTSRMIGARLTREAEGNVAIEVSGMAEEGAFEVAGRGELQLAVLIETMRREGFELLIGRPRVLMREDPQGGVPLEPIEEIHIDVAQAFVGDVVNAFAERRAELIELRPSGRDKIRALFHGPSRGLIGFNSELLTVTRGTAVMHRIFHGYAPFKGTLPRRQTGVLISTSEGRAVAYALWNLEERGALFIEPGMLVYGGMIIGEHTRPQDLDVNPLKSKHLTNIRAAGKDDAVRLSPPRRMSLEIALAYLADDELLEVTPVSIRLRKRFLDPHARRRAARTDVRAR
ncbi:translational GTPase TypA [Candidatus Rariloculus sp.]|uniref:translational GTPase TypA n=1 Tax=Candidatus Rariloculus sp. TaxID=3101265 RepID=UPI003D0FC566